MREDVLPPIWVDTQEAIDESISRIEDQCKLRFFTETVSQLKHLRIQRFKPKFDDEENKKLDL